MYVLFVTLFCIKAMCLETRQVQCEQHAGLQPAGDGDHGLCAGKPYRSV